MKEQDRQMIKLCNMESYCWTHEFHPVRTTYNSKTCDFKKEGHHDNAMQYCNHLEGSTYWLIAFGITIEQQNYAAWKNKNKPNCQRPGMVAQDNNLGNAYNCNKLKQSLTSDSYAILSLPPCQVKKQELPNTHVQKGKGSITFHLPPNHQHDNKIGLRWKHHIANHQMARANCNALQVSVETMAQLAAIQCNNSIAHVRPFNHDNNTLRHQVLNRSIPSTVVDSCATASVGTKKDSKHFISTGKQSNKIFYAQWRNRISNQYQPSSNSWPKSHTQHPHHPQSQ